MLLWAFITLELWKQINIKVKRRFNYYSLNFYKLTLTVFKCTLSGEPAQPEQCPSPTPATTRYCTVTCPLNCILEPWSEWTECGGQSCQEGHRFRARRVERLALYGGTGCEGANQEGWRSFTEKNSKSSLFSYSHLSLNIIHCFWQNESKTSWFVYGVILQYLKIF